MSQPSYPNQPAAPSPQWGHGSTAPTLSPYSASPGSAGHPASPYSALPTTSPGTASWHVAGQPPAVPQNQWPVHTVSPMSAYPVQDPAPYHAPQAGYAPQPMAQPMAQMAYPQPMQPIIINNSAAAAASATTVVVGYRRKTSHLFHLVMTIITCGLWAPVWIIMAIRNSRP